VSAEHRTGGHEQRGEVHRLRAHEQAGGGLVATAHENGTVDGIGADELLRLHRQQIAVQHRRRLLEWLGQRHGRHLDRKSARLPDSTLDIFGTLAEVSVARIDVAPGVDDRNDWLATIIRGVVSHLRRSRPMAE
jgi:hypothetical protein